MKHKRKKQKNERVTAIERGERMRREREWMETPTTERKGMKRKAMTITMIGYGCMEDPKEKTVDNGQGKCLRRCEGILGGAALAELPSSTTMNDEL